MNDPEHKDGTGPAEPVEMKPEKESFVQRVGMTGLLGGVAAVITAVAALVGAFNKPGSATPDSSRPSPATAAITSGATARDSFVISDYWSGTPEQVNLPIMFHVFADGNKVLGTVMSPCQGNFVAPIDSGSWDGSRLILHISKLGEGHQPITLDVTRAGDRLEGSFTQVPYDGHVTLRRGGISCPEVQLPPKNPTKE